jgi:hypothetical protein
MLAEMLQMARCKEFLVISKVFESLRNQGGISELAPKIDAEQSSLKPTYPIVNF